MSSSRIAALVAAATVTASAQGPTLPGVGTAMQQMVARQEVAGAVTVVVSKDRVLHLEATGWADLAAKRPMTPDTLFWIASMTKPVTGVAILMLQDEGKLEVSDPVAKYLPGFADLKTPSGKPANLTITQILTHTSGLGEAPGPAAQQAKTLADLEKLWLAAPMQYEPGAQWKYTQSGINAASRVVEVISGMTFDAFVQQRIFDPLGMKDTTFYPTDAQLARLATAYVKNADSGRLDPVPPRRDYGPRNRPPQGNGGLYSTAPDYARFCRMLLNGGTLDGRRYLSAKAMRALTTPLTGDLPTGFFQTEAWGNRGANYGWGLATSILRTPHDGVASMLSPGTYGHGGAWGTQAWIDPVKGVAYILMIQRSGLPNSDGSDVRQAFQQAAAAALAAPSVALFDGKTLSGWHKPQGVPADYRGGKWEVIDGALVGDQDPPGMGGFLVTDKIYRDYIIEFDVHLDEPADSGVFLRMGEDGKNHQLTLDNDQNKKFGDVYLSWGRETVHEAPEGKKHFRQGAWNTVKIQIQGEPARIRFWLNGVAITDFQHTAETTSGVPKEGRIGLQIHAGKDWNSGSKVRFRNIRLTEL